MKGRLRVGKLTARVLIRLCGVIVYAALLPSPAGTQSAPAPQIFGISNAANYRPVTELGGFLAPGTLVTISGTGLAAVTEVASSTPLPIVLGGANVVFNEIPAPLLSVSPGQIVAQVPFELQPGTVAVQVRRGQLVSVPVRVQLESVAPGIFGPPFLSFPIQTARPGDILAVFGTGLGSVRPVVQSGSLPSTPLPQTLLLPKVYIGGILAEVTYSGLAPCCVGVYQVNVRVPARAPTNYFTDVTLEIGGFLSNTVFIEVRDNRVVANEASAVRSLQAIGNANGAYAARYGVGFAGSLSHLGPPCAGCSVSSSGANLLDATLSGVNPATANPLKDGYEFTYVPFNVAPTAAVPSRSYSVVATPTVPGTSGVSTFCLDHTNYALGEDRSGLATTASAAGCDFTQFPPSFPP
jgi:uncharacterized protein (TIGR03437 family)